MRAAFSLICVVLFFMAASCQLQSPNDFSDIFGLNMDNPDIDVFLNRLCPRGTTFKRCGSACENSCNNFCTRQCVFGCFCPPEQIKVGHKCLPREAFCATKTTTPPTCPKGQAWNDCGTLCDNQCPGTACKLSCEPGCYCPRGTQKVISEDNIESCEPLDCKCKDSDEDTEVPDEHLKDFYGTF